MTTTDDAPTGPQPLPWEREGWLDQLTAWIDAELARLGASRTGPVEQFHVRPWSTVLRVPTTGGTLYCKAVSAYQRHEPALHRLLAEVDPGLLPPLLAADTDAGWMLMPDGGGRLRELMVGADDVRRWEPILARYAELQLRMGKRTPEMVALGAPDRRTATLPDAYRALLDDRSVLVAVPKAGPDEAEMTALHAYAVRLEEICGQLVATGVRDSVQHDDLHDANVFARDDGTQWLFDWGDASVAFPLASFAVVEVSVENRLGLAADAPEVLRLRDAYLEPFTAVVPRDVVDDVFPLAIQLAAVGKALSWQRVIRMLGADRLEPSHRGAVFAWLRELLEGASPEE